MLKFKKEYFILFHEFKKNKNIEYEITASLRYFQNCLEFFGAKFK